MTSRREIIAGARAALIEQAVAFVGGTTAEEERAFRARVQALIDEADEDELYDTVVRLQSDDKKWGYHPPDPFARRMHHAMGDVGITRESRLVGLENLDGLGDAKLLLAANHLSYSDANVLEILLVRYGRDDLARRLAVVAGPKVYSALFRRFSSLCFGTIKTPQSSARSSGEAVMPPRDVARIARETIKAALDRVDQGDALLVFVEGSRSRTASMQRALAAVVRYVEHPGLCIVPVGISGSERLIPIGEERVHPTTVHVHFGRPLRPGPLLERALPRRQLAADVMGLAIAELLPAPYRGVYGSDSEHGEARQLLTALRSGSR